MSTNLMPSRNDNFPTINITYIYEISYPFINGIEENDRSRIDKGRVNQHVLYDSLDYFNSSKKERR